MGRFTTKKFAHTTSTANFKYWLTTKVGMVKRTSVVIARNLLARITGQLAVAPVGVRADHAAADRLGRARQRQTLALLHARLGWRPVRGGSGSSSD